LYIYYVKVPLGEQSSRLNYLKQLTTLLETHTKDDVLQSLHIATIKQLEREMGNHNGLRQSK